MNLHSLSDLGRLPLDQLVRDASTPPLDAAVERDLAVSAAEGDTAALESLVRAHLRDVVDEAIANRGEVPVERLVRRGINGLLAAAREYVPSRDGGFGRYARGRIRTAVRSALLAH